MERRSMAPTGATVSLMPNGLNALAAIDPSLKVRGRVAHARMLSVPCVHGSINPAAACSTCPCILQCHKLAGLRPPTLPLFPVHTRSPP